MKTFLCYFFIITVAFSGYSLTYAENIDRKHDITDENKAKRAEKDTVRYAREASKFQDKSLYADGRLRYNLAEEFRDLAKYYLVLAGQKRRIAEAYRTGNKDLLKDATAKYKTLTEERGKMQAYVKNKCKMQSEKILKLKKKIEKLQSKIKFFKK